MAASTDLTSLDGVKEYLHVDDTDEDAILAALVSSASEAIERYTGRLFGTQEITEYHDGAGRDTIALRRVPVLSVSSVHDDLARQFGDPHLIPADRYVVDSEAGLIRLDAGSFADGHGNVKIVYTAGYEAVPHDVALACNLLVAALWHRAKRRHDGVAGESAAGQALTYEEGWPAAVRHLLAPHVVPTI